ncbi:hypothetical protein COW46_03140 [Candidatus Gracilibacteria bacterium CG17_big_fil_post_rev_8_21_14_2_50_48_13]|nr:MAG: hypothetical protein COW46_03140 [Candidatus Gracilibacteria bacterium CG17_big_fil_post_rev_8_21_14_2_50_48_13]
MRAVFLQLRVKKNRFLERTQVSRRTTKAKLILQSIVPAGEVFRQIFYCGQVPKGFAKPLQFPTCFVG